MSKLVSFWWKRVVFLGVLLVGSLSIFLYIPKDNELVIRVGIFAGSQWDVPNDDCYKVFDEAIEEFEQEYKNVRIEYVSGIMKDDYSEWLAEAALNGQMPDVFLVLPQDLNTFSSIGILKDLTPMIEADKSFDVKAYYPGCYAAGTTGNRQYAIPYESVPSMMFANKSLLKQEGMEVPDEYWNWDTFYELCTKLTKDQDKDGVVDQFGMYGYGWKDALYSNGASLFSEDGKSSNFHKNEVKNALSFAKETCQIPGQILSTSEAFDLGYVGFRPMSYAEFKTYKPYPYKLNKYFNFDWDCINFPSGTDGKATANVDNLLIGISAKTKKASIAWEFLKKLAYDKETQLKLFQYSEGISPLREVTNSEKAEKILEESLSGDSFVKVDLLNEIMETAVPRTDIKDYNEIMEYIDGEIMKLMFVDNEEYEQKLLDLKQKIDKKLMR